MVALVRLGIFGFIALTIIYVLVSLYSRSVRREKLEDRADVAIAEGSLDPGARAAYIEDGMRAYEQSLRRKLIWGVYVVPVLAVIVIVYVTNFM